MNIGLAVTPVQYPHNHEHWAGCHPCPVPQNLTTELAVTPVSSPELEHWASYHPLPVPPEPGLAHAVHNRFTISNRAVVILFAPRNTVLHRII